MLPKDVFSKIHDEFQDTWSSIEYGYVVVEITPYDQSARRWNDSNRKRNEILARRDFFYVESDESLFQPSIKWKRSNRDELLDQAIQKARYCWRTQVISGGVGEFFAPRKDELTGSGRVGRSRYGSEYDEGPVNDETQHVFVCIATKLPADKEDRLANAIANRFSTFF